jgi:hypothetical protein
MGLIEKLKLLFKMRQPATDLITEIKDVKSGWKTWQFWITLLGTLSALATACSGLLPLSTVLIITTVIALITAVYNVWRGAVKSQTPGQKPFFQSSEFWVSVVSCASTAIVTLQTGGVNPKWFETAIAAITVILGSLGAGQNLAGQQPGATPAVSGASPTITASANVPIDPTITK